MRGILSAKAKRIVVIGGGGHAKVVIDAILSSGLFRILGVLDPQLKAGEKILGYPVLGGDEYLEELKDGNKSFMLAIGIGTIKASDKRKTIFEKYKNFGFQFPAIIHSNACISKSAWVSDGVQVLAGAIIQPEAQIGENSIINTGSIIEHNCLISPHCHIAIGAVLAGNVSVGKCSHIGMGAKVLQGVKIGNYVTVGAGAVVINDVGDGKTVVGVPAKEILSQRP